MGVGMRWRWQAGVAGWLSVVLAGAEAAADDDAGDSAMEPAAERARSARVFASGACFDGAGFRARVAERVAGGLRAPDETEASWWVDATVERCAPFEQDVYIGRVCGRDPEGHEWTRTVLESDCETVADALASIAADFVMNPPQYVPLPEKLPSTKRNPRARGGGIIATGVVAHDLGTGTTGSGLRVLAAAHAGKRFAPRVGGSAQLTFADHGHPTARAGGVVGWGAPWKDVAPGVVLEAGAISRWARPSLEPYAAVSLILQLSTRIRVTPLLAFTTTVMPFVARGEDNSMHAAEVGLAIRAW